VYLGTDYGVYYTTDAGGTWQPLGIGLPFSAVDDLVLHNGARVLRAATHGRSFFEFDLDQIGIKEQGGLTGIDEKGIVLQVTSPARNEIGISYSLSRTSFVRLDIYDITGRQIENLLNSTVAAGKYTMSTVLNLPAGTYFVTMEAQGETITQKITIVK
jgi:hypothetical protein